MSNEATKRGRKKIAISLDTLKALAMVGCTNEEMAAHFGVSLRTIESRRREEAIREAIDKGFALGNISLRRKQMSLALKGDRTMLVWLGKQRLGQKDKMATELSGKVEGGGAPPIIHVNFVSPGDPEAHSES